LFINSITKSSYAQQGTVNVTDQTLKIAGGSVESLFFGFAAGDEIIFSFEESNGKPLRVIEIIELPESKKFSEFKAVSIVEKRIKVYQKGVFEFRFDNEALTGRVCKIKIDRVPSSSDLISFNTDWKWETVYDTIFTPYKQDSLVGYDTLHYKETLRELIKTEQTENLVMDRTEKVHSYMNSNGNHAYVKVDFPQIRHEEFYKEKITAWAYWIGVGEESNTAYAQNVKAYGGAASKVVGMFNPLAGVALGVVTHLITPTSGEDVTYRFFDSYDKLQVFLSGQTCYPFVSGTGIAAYGQNNKLLKGPIYIGLYNDNNVMAIDVNIKIVVIVEQSTYADVEHDRMKITPRYVTLNKVRIKVSSSKIRVNVE
jgi:hypothetical protein